MAAKGRLRPNIAPPKIRYQVGGFRRHKQVRAKSLSTAGTCVLSQLLVGGLIVAASVAHLSAGMGSYPGSWRLETEQSCCRLWRGEHNHCSIMIYPWCFIIIGPLIVSMCQRHFWPCLCITMGRVQSVHILTVSISWSLNQVWRRYWVRLIKPSVTLCPL